MKVFKYSVLLFFLAFVGCKENSPSPECILSESTLQGAWKITDLKHKENAQSNEVDIFATSTACKKDDIYVFNSNHTYQYNDLGLFCSPPDSYEGRWALSGGVITFDSTNSYTISAANCNSMKVIKTGSAVGEYLLVTFTKQ